MYSQKKERRPNFRINDLISHIWGIAMKIIGVGYDDDTKEIIVELSF